MPVTAIVSSIEHRPEEKARENAATLIQRAWRSRRNIVKAELLNLEHRWDDALTDTRLEVARRDALQETTSPRQRWKRAVLLVGRLRAQHPLYNHPGPMSLEDEKYLKELEGQHWLELIDGKHRYGSNLKWYHQRWQHTDTGENFFKWLDMGEGKEVSVNECSRERLDLERIIYLSNEQRLNYLVTITDDGKLVWAKNQQPVDTSAGQWKDSEDGGGIFPEHVPTPVGKAEKWPILGKDNTLQEEGSNTQKNEATHYAGPGQGRHSWSRYLWRHLTIWGLAERLLRKTVKQNTWIYITDREFNIFIGIKETGYFQHSSFLAGGIVSSAGLIKVKNGRIRSISPLSGHYRTSIDHFRNFIRVLDDRGVGLSRISIAKAEAALWGIERLGRTRKKQKKMVKQGKEAAKELPENIWHTVSQQFGHNTELCEDNHRSA